MTCDEARRLIEALLDGELDAGHAAAVEAHAAACPACATALAQAGDLRDAVRAAPLMRRAPPALRARIEAALPSAPRGAATPDRRTLLKGFALGGAVSGTIAASVAMLVIDGVREERRPLDVVSAHLRALQGARLTDVEANDRHVVKPWFNGRLDLAPPVPDLTAKGFTLLGGRLDYLDGKPVAAIVYRRRRHVVDLFVEPGGSGAGGPRAGSLQGFNLRHWADGGLSFWAVSDLAADELAEFAATFERERRAADAR